MDVALFDYSLPPDQVAQEPLPRRDGSRLMVVPRRGAAVEHRRFADLQTLLRPGDLLVVNDTRVVPARLHARRPSGGKVELLVLPPGEENGRSAAEDPWRDCFLRASRRPRPGERLQLPDGGTAEVLVDHGDGRVRLRFQVDSLRELLEAHGSVPVPPYIRRQPEDPRAALDRKRYQTVFARRRGAVAAPTAGLHFTRALLRDLQAAGVAVASLTLHVGPGTFRPLTVEKAEDHRVDPEWFHLPESTAAAVRAARERGGRVIACGTTVVRTLESRATGDGLARAGEGICDLYIFPGHRFRVVDGLITNFHLPRSSLLILVSALAGRERILAAYREAVERGYRFYSYGDAMYLPPPEETP